MISYARPYPCDALGSNIGAAAHEHSQAGIALELTAPFALLAAALYTQDLVNVHRPNTSPSPVSLYVAVIAGSGEGKDFGAVPFFKPAHDFQNGAEVAAAGKYAAHAAEVEVRRALFKNLQSELTKAIKKSRPIDEIQERLQKHIETEPRRPMAPQILFSEATYAGMAKSLAENWQSAALLNLEAGDFFNGTQRLSLAWWNERWGGTPMRKDLATQPRLLAQAPRLSAAIGIQLAPFERFWQKRGAEASDMGFFARVLFSMPPSTSGTRFISTFPMCRHAIHAFQERATELLVAAASIHQADGSHRRTLEFTPGGANRFVNTHNSIQMLMRPFQPYVTIPGVASKAAEMVARVAAVLHTFDGLEGAIGEGTVERAEIIVRWHVEEFLRIATMFAPQKHIRDAYAVEQKLITARAQGRDSLTYEELKRQCRLEITPRRFDDALRHLKANLRIQFAQVGRYDHVMLHVYPQPVIAPPSIGY